MIRNPDWPAFGLALALIILLALIGVWDSYVTLAGREFPTVSTVVKRLAVSHPILPYMAGLLAGHLWF